MPHQQLTRHSLFPADKQSVMMVTQKRALKWLSEGSDRAFPMIGPLALNILLHDHPVETSLSPSKLGGIEGAMEYPPGFLLVPLRSSTLPPFKSTTLIAYAPAAAYHIEGDVAKIVIEDSAREGGQETQEPEPPERDADAPSKSDRTEEASKSSARAESEKPGEESTSKSKPPLPKGKEPAASRFGVEGGASAGGQQPGPFRPPEEAAGGCKREAGAGGGKATAGKSGEFETRGGEAARGDQNTRDVFAGRSGGQDGFGRTEAGETWD